VRESFKDAHFMPDPIFNRIADEAGPHKSVLRFTGGGEPFLHPDIAKHAAYAAERGCKVSIITNGSQDVSSVIDVADMIEFSVDAGTEADYRKARPGLNWETLNRNVQDAISKRHRTHIIVSIIKQRGIDLDEARRHWSFVDAVQMRKFLSFGTEQDNSADHTPYLPNAEKVPCPWLFDRVLINSRGHYTLCNIDIGFRFGFSSIMDRSIADVWRGREFENARLKHLTGKADELEMCKGCKDLQYRSWKFSYFKLRDYASRHSPA